MRTSTRDASLAVGAALAPEEIARRRDRVKSAQRVIFGVRALYGLSRESVAMPLNEAETIDSGPISVTLDSDADEAGNIGIVDYEHGTLTVRYAIQAVFPGLYDLVRRRKYEASLLNPVRAVATDECTLTDNLSGWHALGCLEFLPGSLWAGAAGG